MECDNMTDFRANDIGEVTRGTTFYLIVKRTIDILGALIGLVLLSPIFLIVAIAIIAVLTYMDMWSVNKRYLNEQDFVAKRSVSTCNA